MSRLSISLLYRGHVGSCIHRSITTSNTLKGTFTRPNGNWVQRFVRRLDESERLMLLNELSKRVKESTSQVSTDNASPIAQSNELSASHFRMIYIANGLPFIGFGFLDNAIMIVAGEYIDLTFASLFGLSTMAGEDQFLKYIGPLLAAGLGNLVSDIFGLGLAGYVERFAAKMGFVVPHLTTEQYKSRSNRMATILGRCTGITIGCLLGLLPLLFFQSKSKSDSVDHDIGSGAHDTRT